MDRRMFLASLPASTAVLSGCTALGKSYERSRPVYYGRSEVVYERDNLNLDLLWEPIHLGETIKVRITNTSDSDIGFGCKMPWAIQKRVDDEWKHVAWTAKRYTQLCATLLGPDDSHLETLPLSKPGLELHADVIRSELSPGRYRFLLIGTSPYVGIDFDVLNPA